MSQLGLCLTISIILIFVSALIFCIIPPDDTVVKATDDDLIWIFKDDSWLEIHESNLDIFLDAGWQVYEGDDEE